MAGTGSQGAEPSVARHAARRKRKGADSGGAPPEEAACELLRKRYVKGSSVAAGQVNLAVQDSYKRLLAPSLENELRTHLKEQADREAIKVFVDNLRGLLLASPLGRKRVMALGPGFRTGAKLVCLGRPGRNSPTMTSPSAALFPLAGGCRTPWPGWWSWSPTRLNFLPDMTCSPCCEWMMARRPMRRIFKDSTVIDVNWLESRYFFLWVSNKNRTAKNSYSGAGFLLQKRNVHWGRHGGGGCATQGRST